MIELNKGTLKVRDGDKLKDINLLIGGMSEEQVQNVIDKTLDDVFEKKGGQSEQEVSLEKGSDLLQIYSARGRLAHSTDGHFVSDNGYEMAILKFNEDTSISIKKQKGGIVGAVVFSEILETIPTSSSESKQYYIVGGRSNDTSYPLPDDSSKWDVLAGQMVVIFYQDTSTNVTTYTVTYTVKSRGLTYELKENVTFGKTQSEEIKRISRTSNTTPFVKYGNVDTDIGSRGKEQVSIYLPSAVGFVKYAFIRNEYDETNSNNWRIDRAYACDNDKVVRFPITNKGEWEMAIKLEGRSDFIGGNAHGDEVFDSVKFYVDGKEMTTSMMFDGVQFSELKIVELSTMYDPSDNATLATKSNFEPVAKHGREYIITNEGIKLNQFIVWLTNVRCDASYMTMFPVIRGNDSIYPTIITDNVYTDDDYEVYDCSSITDANTANKPWSWSKNCTRCVIWSDESGVSCDVEMLKQTDIDNSGAKQFKIQNSSEYNKLYWSICGVGNAIYEFHTGDRVYTSTRYAITVNK